VAEKFFQIHGVLGKKKGPGRGVPRPVKKN
jgi:hypothetical protein